MTISCNYVIETLAGAKCLATDHRALLPKQKSCPLPRKWVINDYPLLNRPFHVFDDTLSDRQEFAGAVTKPNINHHCSATSGVYCLAISQKIHFKVVLMW
jgi:hypothetical protein